MNTFVRFIMNNQKNSRDFFEKKISAKFYRPPKPPGRNAGPARES